MDLLISKLLQIKHEMISNKLIISRPKTFHSLDELINIAGWELANIEKQNLKDKKTK